MEIYNYINGNLYEFFGVLFSFIYVFFSIKQNILCWPVLIIASVLNMIAYNNIGLPLQVGMQFFFIGTAIYGWHNWNSDNTLTLKVTTFGVVNNIKFISIGLILTLILTFILNNLTIDSLMYSEYPFWDALMFMFNIIPMYMMGKKILESWVYFIVIDIISGCFWFTTNEYFYCILFFGYIPFAITGFMEWKKTCIND
jgi:nicotinamide mononucleotide transporter